MRAVQTGPLAHVQELAGVNVAVEAGGALGGLLGGVVGDSALRQRLFQFNNLSLGEGGYNGTVDNGELHPTANECSIPMWLYRG